MSFSKIKYMKFFRIRYHPYITSYIKYRHIVITPTYSFIGILSLYLIIGVSLSNGFPLLVMVSMTVRLSMIVRMSLTVCLFLKFTMSRATIMFFMFFVFFKERKMFFCSLTNAYLGYCSLLYLFWTKINKRWELWHCHNWVKGSPANNKCVFILKIMFEKCPETQFLAVKIYQFYDMRPNQSPTFTVYKFWRLPLAIIDQKCLHVR